VLIRVVFRYFTPETKELIRTRMCQVCCGLAQTYGGEIDVVFDGKLDEFLLVNVVGNIYFYVEAGYPPTVNAYPDCVANVHKAAARVVGDKNSRLPQKTMGAEDFSFFLECSPGMCAILWSCIIND
jgi:metal-dependent amidase/aminoacylase/carboxypeptidase family protein